jgi:ribosomal protein S18 acetylase RimI-like enzyme/catechol 2,3-dioxygenase-like lactoylglutathione lyase family enzyme
MKRAAIEITEPGPADLARTVELLHQQLAGHDVQLTRESIAASVRELLARPSTGRILIARSEEGIVGAALLSFVWTLEHGGATTWLDELYVDPSHRRGGIGSELVRAVVRLAEAEGCRALDLEVAEGHEEAARLYERLGFQRHRRTRWVLPLATAPGRAVRVFPSLPTAVAADPRPVPSLDHISLGVNDLARSKAFYDAALAPLGLVAHKQITGELAYGPPGEAPKEGFAFYVGFEDPAAKAPVAPSAGFHVALHAPSRAAVREFHAAALAHGGRSFGEPGLRPHYHADYFGAFVLDPDGHHVEAVHHGREA